MKDLLLGLDFDLIIEDGDLVVGESDLQNQELLIICDKGDFKDVPDRCVGVERWLKDEDVQGMLAEIKKEFERDGMTVKTVFVNEKNELKVDAFY